jgi:hypothetical protein
MCTTKCDIETHRCFTGPWIWNREKAENHYNILKELIKVPLFRLYVNSALRISFSRK